MYAQSRVCNEMYAFLGSPYSKTIKINLNDTGLYSLCSPSELFTTYFDVYLLIVDDSRILARHLYATYVLSECITSTTIYIIRLQLRISSLNFHTLRNSTGPTQTYSMRTNINSHQSAMRITKLNLTTRRHFIRDVAMRVKGYKMSCVYILRF